MDKEDFIILGKEYLEAHKTVTQANKDKKRLSDVLKPIIKDKGKVSPEGSYSLIAGGINAKAIFKPKYSLVESVLKKVCKEKGIKRSAVTTITEHLDHRKIEQLHTDGIISDEEIKEIFEEIPSYAISITKEKGSK